MKKVMNKSKMILAIALAVTFTLASAPTFAGSTTDNPVEFKYIGNTNDKPVFLLNLNNSINDEFIVTLKDASGNLIYTEKVSGQNVSRKYRLETDAIEGNEVRVEVSSKKNNSKTVYTVSRKSRVVEDVVVNKL